MKHFFSFSFMALLLCLVGCGDVKSLITATTIASTTIQGEIDRVTAQAKAGTIPEAKAQAFLTWLQPIPPACSKALEILRSSDPTKVKVLAAVNTLAQSYESDNAVLLNAYFAVRSSLNVAVALLRAQTELPPGAQIQLPEQDRAVLALADQRFREGGDAIDAWLAAHEEATLGAE